MLQEHNPSPFLALLIGAPHVGDVAMHNDVVAMYDALRLRGVPPELILSLEGSLNRRVLVEIVASVREEVGHWQDVEVLIAISRPVLVNCKLDVVTSHSFSSCTAQT